jgi:hypothetical protein
MSILQGAKKAIPQAPVITIVGFPGVGKSTLAALFPSPIFIQAENSSTVFETWDLDAQPMLLPVLPSPRLERKIRTSEAIMDTLRELCSADHPYKTVIIDSVTSLASLLEDEVVAFDPMHATSIGDAAGGFHKGYMVSAGMHAEIRRACEHIRRKGIAIVFLAHTGITKMKNRPDSGEYTAFSVDIHEKSKAFYINHSDAVLYLKTEEFISGEEKNKKGQTTKYGKVTNTGDRVLITSSDGTVGYIDAKNRYDMPVEIPVPKGENPLLDLIPFFKHVTTQEDKQI